MPFTATVISVADIILVAKFAVVVARLRVQGLVLGGAPLLGGQAVVGHLPLDLGLSRILIAATRRRNPEEQHCQQGA